MKEYDWFINEKTFPEYHLLIKINIAYCVYVNDNNRKGSSDPRIIVPNKVRPFIEKIEYYNKETQILSSRYIIEFTDKDIDYIDFPSIDARINIKQ